MIGAVSLYRRMEMLPIGFGILSWEMCGMTSDESLCCSLDESFFLPCQSFKMLLFRPTAGREPLPTMLRAVSGSIKAIRTRLIAPDMARKPNI